ncbi:MAG: hypothetical protein AAF849_17115 [Bacteroidota bacterium]
MKDTKYIEQLLNQYFEGGTSMEEEQVLKNYFQQSEIADHLLPYQSMFQYFKAAKNIQREADTMPWSDAVVREMKPRKQPFRWALGIAASIALVLSIWWYSGYTTKEDAIAQIDWSQYEPENPEEALKQTLSALQLLSDQLNGGAQQAAKELDRMIEIGDLIGVQKKGKMEN